MINNQNITTNIRQEYYSITLGEKKFALSARMILVIIAILAVTLRLFSAVYQGNEVSDLPGIYDQISYDGLARRVVDGYGFSFAEGHWPATRAGEPTAHWSYLYTLYLAATYKLFGTYPLIARLLQAVIAGIVQTFLVWRIGRRLFDQPVGLIAAALNAVYVYFIYYAGALITETFYITCILWIFDAVFRIVDKSRNSPTGGRALKLVQWLELGLAIGLTVLLRQLILLFLPFLFLWIWWNVRDNQAADAAGKYFWKQKLHLSAIKGLFVATLVLALLVIPWTIRNYQAFGTFVFLNTNAGFAFFWGNHPIHGTHFMPILSVPGVTYQSLIPRHLMVLNEGQLDKALLQEGIRIVLSDPVRYILLSISRIEEYIKFWPSKDSSLISNISRVSSFGIFLPFMLYGIWVSFSKFRKPAYSIQRSKLLIICLFILVYTSIHLLSWTLIRYRLPIDALLIFFAAFAMETLIRTKLTHRNKLTFGER